MDTAGFVSPSAAVAREHVVPCRVAPEWVLLIPPRRSLGVVDVQAASEPGVAGPVLLAHLVLGGNRWASTCASTPTSSAAASPLVPLPPPVVCIAACAIASCACACLVRRREWDTSPLGTAPDLVLWDAEPIQNYIVEGCPGMIACSSHSPWPFWPVSPPFWSCPLAVSAVFLRDPVRFSVWLFTEWAVCGLVEEGEEGSVRSKPSDPLFNRAWIGNEVENDLR